MADPTVIVQAPVITDTVLLVALAVIGIFIVYLMLREVRLMKTSNRQIEIELEKDKLKLLQQHADAKKIPVHPSFPGTDFRYKNRGRREYRS